jgi:hypothetical protein
MASASTPTVAWNVVLKSGVITVMVFVFVASCANTSDGLRLRPGLNPGWGTHRPGVDVVNTVGGIN